MKAADKENSHAILQAQALDKLTQKSVFDAGEEYVELVSKSGVRLEILPQNLRVTEVIKMRLLIRASTSLLWIGSDG